MEKATPDRFIKTLKMFPDETILPILYQTYPMPVAYLPGDDGEQKFMVLNTEENIKYAINFRLTDMEKHCNKLTQFFWFLTKPNRLQIFELFTHMYQFTEEDYNKTLRDLWIDTEFPHQLQVKKLVDLFNKANPELLMDDEENAVLKDKPDEIKVYRGWSEIQVKKGFTARRGLSYTLNLEKAEWFAKRFYPESARVVEATVNKKNVYMYTNAGGEEELVINPAKIKKIKRLL